MSDDLLKQALDLLKVGNNKQAEELLQHIIENDPNDKQTTISNEHQSNIVKGSGVSEHLNRTIPRWEFEWIFVELDSGRPVIEKGDLFLEGNRAWDHIMSMGKSGWELVSVVQAIGDISKKDTSTKVASLFDFAMAGPRVTPATQHRAATVGYFFWFKRPLLVLPCSLCGAEILSCDKFCQKCGEKVDK